MGQRYSTTLGEVLRIKAISAILNYDEMLLRFVFHHKKIELREAPEELLEEARALSHGEFVLVQCAVDIWNGQGGAKLTQILDTLDDEHLLDLIHGILDYREIEDERRQCLWEYPC